MTLQLEDPPHRLQIAVHEAGHFVVGVHFGLEQQGVFLFGSYETPGGYVSSRASRRQEPPATEHVPNWSDGFAWVKERVAEDLAAGLIKECQAAYRQVAIWLLAGGIAERILRGEELPSRYHFNESASDHWKARYLLSSVFSEYRGEWLRSQEGAWEILKARWPCVMRIAAALSATGAVQGAELSAMHAAGEHDSLSFPGFPDAGGYGRIDFALLLSTP